MNKGSRKVGLRAVKTIKDIPDNAVFYSTESDWESHSYQFFYRLYDANFDRIEDVNVYATDSLLNLQRVVTKQRSRDTIYAMYNLEEIPDTDFYKVFKDKNTLKLFEAALGNLQKG